ncbi:MAG TPA: transglycosylase SLT domain-containing protein [Pyrinomonadaceae bacterium]|nr:transglycosylase SLT domain-containing protein [Pyrinomonadaceae bacterium]HMP64345.1 transglycosylase SLT domain-containing protein [Pyrinomonadaceae bacterium]
MPEVVLTYPTPEGSREIRVDEGRVSFGRGTDADHRFPDAGLSRLHATVYREGDLIWVVDENSSNGTFVNGIPAAPSGTPLGHGDEIKIGNETILTVRISEQAAVAVAPSSGASPQGQGTLGGPMPDTPMSLIPVLLIAFAVLIVSVSAVVVGFKIFGPVQAEVVRDTRETDEYGLPPTPSRTETPKDDTDVRTDSSTFTSNTENETFEELPPVNSGNSQPPAGDILKGRRYLDVSDQEKRQYIADRSMRIAQIIGNRSTDQIPPEAVDAIKRYADGYSRRINSKPLGGCRLGDNLQSMYERASKNAPFIIRAFNEKGIDPRIGIYLAMIESEHCTCLQSPTGPLGMFQFTKATGELHGLKTVSGASPSNPDERCEPEPSARAAASYMKALTARFGTGPSSVPLAIGSYNSGEGGLSSNLVKALESGQGLERDFWTLISKGEILSKQFQAENFKYVPLFFAAAIVGENPQDFGLKLRPISSYTR